MKSYYRKKGLTALILMLNFYLYGQQAQQRIWYLKNNQKIDFTTGVPVASNLNTFNELAGPGNSGSSIYNLSGERILYTDNYTGIFSKYGYIGTMENMLEELGDPLIIPQPGSDCKYFIIYTTAGIDLPDYEPECPNAGSVYFNVFYNEIDLSANNGFGVASQSIPLDICSNAYTHAPFAVSKEIGGERYMYSLAETAGERKIRKYVISSIGIAEDPVIFSSSTLSSVRSVELELSHDRTKLAFANIQGNEVYVVHLDANGNLANTLGTNLDGTSTFSLPSSKIIGLEFSDNGNYLFAGAKYDGIFRIDISSGGSPTIVIPGTQSYGDSELELGYDPAGNYKIYALSRQFDGSNWQVHMGQIEDINIAVPSFNPSVIVGLTPYNYNELIWGDAYGVLHLPEQIDGEDYEAGFVGLTGSCCAAIEGYEVVQYIAPINTTWEPGIGNNPFGGGTIIRVMDEIRIPAGRTVTIKNMEYRFSEQGRIIIEPGAKLILNNTTLTSMDCEGLMWPGVELQGNASIDQLPTSQQGHLFMQNNSEINNAYNGISVYGLTGGAIDWGKTGGLIQANNSTFRNNQRDVEFLAYDFKNYSYFRNCTFITDAQLNDGLSLPTIHVSMFKVDGVKFTGCNFTNAASSPYTGTQAGYGIKSIDAKYYVGYYCNVILPLGTPCPDANKEGCKFENLFCGIEAYANLPYYTVDIRYNDFINNTRGIYLGGVDYSFVVNNNINVSLPIGYSYGLYLDNCNAYAVENNAFTTSYSSGTYGSIDINSNEGGVQPYVNEIYKNTFDGFHYAMASALANVMYTASGGTDTGTGLTFKCNQFTNSADFDILNTYGGICAFQGNLTPLGSNESPHREANNEFSYTATIGDIFNNNPVELQFDYRFEPSAVYNTNPRDAYTNMALGVQSETENQYFTLDRNISCPAKRFDLTKFQIKFKSAEYVGIASVLENQIDGGDTDALIAFINSNMSIDDLKNLLLEHSPYLSDEVLLALINRTPTIAHEVLMQIILANAPVSDDVYEVLNNLGLPGGIITQIGVAQTGTSALYELQSEISYYSRESELLKNELTRRYLNDSTIVNGEDSVKLILDNDTNTNKCRMAALLVKKGEYTEAESLIDSIINYGDAYCADFAQYLDIVMELEQTTKKCYALEEDSSRTAELEAIATKVDDSRDCFQATVLLNRIFNYPYQEYIPYYAPAMMMMLIPDNDDSSVKAQEAPKVIIYPNPANEYLTVELLLKDKELASAKIYDFTGKLMLTDIVTDSKSYLNVSSLKNGVYILKIGLADGQFINEKLIIK